MGIVKRLHEAIKDSDLVLLDASIFGGGREIAEQIYEAVVPAELKLCEDELRQAHNIWDLQLRLIAKADNVYTIPEVANELKEFERILTESLSWHQQRVGTNGRHQFKKERKETDKQDAICYTTPTALHLINCLVCDVRRTISLVPIYEGPIRMFPQDAQVTTDNLLVGAAVGYFEANPNKAVTVVSRDREINDNLRNYVLDTVVNKVMERTGL